jgi:hypothetical protein
MGSKTKTQALVLPEGLITEAIPARTQEVSDILRGYTLAATKDGRPMYVLYFEQDGAIATINMMESADHPDLVVDEFYTARWVDKTFEIFKGATKQEAPVEADEDPFV